MHIAHHHIGFETDDGVDGIGHRAGFGHHINVAVSAFLEFPPDSGTHQGVIVD